MIRSLTSVRVHKRSELREEGASLRERKSGAHFGPQGTREHVSVMGREAVEWLDLHDGETVVDATAGQGGHSEAILRQARVNLIAIDADPEAVERTNSRLEKFRGHTRTIDVLEGNFGDLARILAHHHGKEVDKILFDLGWNIGQLASGRGFSFMHDEPLSMSYGQNPASGFTAAQILNIWKEKTIADVLFGYGEERYARRIARAIAERREVKPIETTLELVEIINDAVPPVYRHGKLHPATRTFQALRIATNDELGVLKKGLTAGFAHLSRGGRIVVITFHSVEDRLVKRLFLEFAREGRARVLTKKPLAAGSAEITANPPSRSAKLRAIEKI